MDAAYLGAAIAGTTGDIFPPESYASPAIGPGGIHAAHPPGGGTGPVGHGSGRLTGPFRPAGRGTRPAAG